MREKGATSCSGLRGKMREQAHTHGEYEQASSEIFTPTVQDPGRGFFV